jgi:hypothetical protein
MTGIHHRSPNVTWKGRCVKLMNDQILSGGAMPPLGTCRRAFPLGVSNGLPIDNRTPRVPITDTCLRVGQTTPPANL